MRPTKLLRYCFFSFSNAAVFNTQVLPLGTVTDAWSAVADMNPAVVCISALASPFAIDHTRILYQKLRSESPKLDVVICLWNFEGDLAKTARRMKMTDGRRLRESLNGVMEHVTARTRPSVRESNGLSEITMTDTSVEIPSTPRKPSSKLRVSGYCNHRRRS